MEQSTGKRNNGFWLIWIGLIAYAFVLAPPEQPDTFELIKRLSTGQFAGINPLIVALFNLLGVFPLIYACLLFFDGRGQSIRAWIFSLGSFGVGAFALLPYLALRRPNPHFIGQKNWLLKLLDSRWLGGLLLLGALGLLFYGISQGDWVDYGQQFQASRFVHVMSIDFCLTSLLFPALLADDMARRGLQNRSLYWFVSLLPLIGAALYLVLRPPIPVTTTDPATTVSSESYSSSS